MNCGFSAESRSASLSLLTATARRWSKSTKVSADQRRLRSSSRVTTSPAYSKSTARSRKGCSCSRTLLPSLRNSPARRSTSKFAKRTNDGRVDGIRVLHIFEKSSTQPNTMRYPIALQTDDLLGDREGIEGEVSEH